MFDPLQADDWLRAVERQLDIAQCDDRECVLYAAGQLQGAALDWWESHPVQDREALTWLQFRERFRSHNVPAGVMKMKQKEIPCTEADNLRYNPSAFPFELMPPCSILMNLELIYRYLSVFVTSGDYVGHGVS